MAAATHIAPYLVHDDVALPTDDVPVRARSERTDSYDVFVTRSPDEALTRLVALVDGAQVALVSDHAVLALHGEVLVRGLREHGANVHVATLAAGEASKSVPEAVRLWDWLANSSIGRRDVLVAFGGGVINDTGGWVASAFMRGLRYVNVPTTLLAQVDGALGGKVAVNHPVAKNLIGAFHQPLGVISDVGYLQTLDDRHLRAGIAECVKKAMIASPAYWDYLEAQAGALLERHPDALERLVRCATTIKTALIERDPYEEDLRRPLNFGHTIGHPLETVTGYGALLHGEAVAFGMVVEARIAADRGLLGPALLDRLIGLLRRLGLPTTAEDLPPGVEATGLLAAMDKVRLIRAGSLRYVLPLSLGETLIADDVAEAEVRRALRATGVR